MLALKKLFTARIKKNPIESMSDDDDDDEIIVREANELGDAFDKAIDVLADGSLYGHQMVEIIRRIVRQYSSTSTKRIESGMMNAKWTVAKIKHAKHLEYVAEGAMKDAAPGPDLGRTIQSNLIRGIEEYKTDYLPAARLSFSDEQKMTPPDVGTFETGFLPAIEKSIDIVFRVYRLYQIENRTDADFRVTGEGSEEAVRLVQAAHKMAKEATEQLLGDFSTTSIERASKCLTEIQAQYRELFRTSTAAKGKQASSSEGLPGVDRSQLFHVSELFTRKFDDMEQKAIYNAAHNYRNVAKNIVVGTAGAVVTTASALGNTGTYLTEKFLDLAIGDLEGPKSKRRSADYIPLPDSPMDGDLSSMINDDYEGQTPPSSPATRSTLLRLSPTSASKKPPTQDTLDATENNNNNNNRI